MKKAILLLALLIMAPKAFAYVEEYTTSDIKTLTGAGYSQETLEVVDTARMLKQGTERDYVPFYKRNYYSSNPVLKWYQVAKRYIDPAQNEHVFGVREIRYQNGWFDFSPSYSELVTPNDRYQRLYDKDIERLETAGKIVKGSNGIEPSLEDNSVTPTEELIIEDL